MLEFQSQAESVLKSEMTNAGLEISAKENGRKGVNFIIKSPNGKQSEVFLQPMDLIAQQSSKVPKGKFGEPRESLCLALIALFLIKNL